MGTREISSIDWRSSLCAGLIYTLGVFLFAFAVGTIRVTLIAPRLGALWAVIIEAPIVLAVSWQVSRWCTRRFNVSRDARARMLMGAAAFSVLMLLEIGFSVLIFGETVNQYVRKFTSAPGFVGLSIQCCFAMFPWVQSRVRSKVSQSTTHKAHLKPRDARR